MKDKSWIKFHIPCRISDILFIKTHRVSFELYELREVLFCGSKRLLDDQFSKISFYKSFQRKPSIIDTRKITHLPDPILFDLIIRNEMLRSFHSVSMTDRSSGYANLFLPNYQNMKGIYHSLEIFGNPYMKSEI